MDEAARRLQALGRPRGVIATTDGDTAVRPDWVAMNLREIARGADAVGGRIFSTPQEVGALDAGARLYYRRDTAYRTLRAAYECVLSPDPSNGWPRHHHCFGASLAVTLETYLRAGGLPVVPLPGRHGVRRRARTSRRAGAPESARRRADEPALRGPGGRGAVGHAAALVARGRRGRAADGGIRRVHRGAMPQPRTRAAAVARGARPRRGVARAAADFEVDPGWLDERWRLAAGARRVVPGRLDAPAPHAHRPVGAAAGRRWMPTIAELRAAARGAPAGVARGGG